MIDTYAKIVGEEVVDQLRQLAAPLQGARVVNQRPLPDGSVEVEMEVELTEEFFKALQSR